MALPTSLLSITLVALASGCAAAAPKLYPKSIDSQIFTHGSKAPNLKAALEFWAQKNGARVAVEGEDVEVYTKSGGPKLTLLPCASDLLPSFFRRPREPSVVLVNCITASPRFDGEATTISIFPKAAEYLRSVFRRLKKVERSPRRLLFLFEKEPAYMADALDEVMASARAELSEGFPRGLPTQKIELGKFIADPKSSFDRRDWLILWTVKGPDVKGIQALRGFNEVLKIVPYSRPGPASYWTRSANVLFWHPNISYDGQDQNCGFVREFKHTTGRQADFHAAYLFAHLEVADQVARNSWRPHLKNVGHPLPPAFSSIIGKLRLKADGRAENYEPTVIRKTEEGTLVWDLGGQGERHPCPFP